MDTADIATLNDALGSAGVDLRVSPQTFSDYFPFTFAFLGRGRDSSEVT